MEFHSLDFLKICLFCLLLVVLPNHWPVANYPGVPAAAIALPCLGAWFQHRIYGEGRSGCRGMTGIDTRMGRRYMEIAYTIHRWVDIHWERTTYQQLLVCGCNWLRKEMSQSMIWVRVIQYRLDEHSFFLLIFWYKPKQFAGKNWIQQTCAIVFIGYYGISKRVGRDNDRYIQESMRGILFTVHPEPTAIINWLTTIDCKTWILWIIRCTSVVHWLRLNGQQ